MFIIIIIVLMFIIIIVVVLMFIIIIVVLMFIIIMSKLCDHGPIKQRMHVLPVYMICFLKLLPQIMPD
jgi:hypothetical protein